jgi:hypothetical protein
MTLRGVFSGDDEMLDGAFILGRLLLRQVAGALPVRPTRWLVSEVSHHMGGVHLCCTLARHRVENGQLGVANVPLLCPRAGAPVLYLT